MKIKHFAGYGSVEATKVSKKTVMNEFDEPMINLVVKVKGNHEWGLVRDDDYDLYNWLIKKFDKGVKDYYSIHHSLDYSYSQGWEDGVDVCTYTFKYKA